MFVTTLPITPRKTARFTTILSPFIASLLARFLEIPYLISLNGIGRRFQNLSVKEVQELIQWYETGLKTVGIQGNAVWNELTPGYFSYVIKQTQKLLHDGTLHHDISDILLCDCGAVELMSHLKSHTFSGKVVDVHTQDLTCKLCNTVPKTVQQPSLFFRVPKTRPFSITPAWIQKEIQALDSKFKGNNIRISRLREKNLQVHTSDHTFGLDTDYIWGLYIPFICEQMKQNSVCIVTSNRTIIQALRVVQLSQLIDPNINIQLLVNPTLEIICSPEKEDLNKRTLDSCLEILCPLGIRYLLADALTWGQKEIRRPSSVVHLIQQSINPSIILKNTQTNDQERNLSTFLNICTSTATQNLLTNLRKKRPLTNKEEILHQLLT